MPTTDLVAPNAIIPALKVNGKKQALQEIAAKAAELAALMERYVTAGRSTPGPKQNNDADINWDKRAR